MENMIFALTLITWLKSLAVSDTLDKTSHQTVQSSEDFQV